MYSSRHLATIFTVSNETIRAWSMEFGRYMSPSANPGPKKHRQFTEDDLRIVALVADMKKRGFVFDDIHTALANGERGDPPISTANTLVVYEQQREMVLLEAQIESLTNERDDLRDRLRPTEDENVRLKAVNDMLAAQVEQLRAAADRLAAAERELELWRSGRLRPDDE